MRDVQRHRRRSNKSPGLYLCILGLWAMLMAPLLIGTSPLMSDALHHNVVVGVLVTTTVAFISYFWLNGVKDVVYTLYYHLWFQKRVTLPPARSRRNDPLVLLVYCTCNDFNGESLLASMQQDYSNYRVVILDDSSKPEYLAEVDTFAALHGITVIRRSNREGFKAGNLNNYLRNVAFDYFVILDSDEIIPPYFINRALDYFAADRATGIVQANHRATRNRTEFMKMFARGVDSHWPTYQAVKDRYGFLSLLGHGAMVSNECYRAAQGFPHVVAEDICFSIAAREAGYMTVFAIDIVCEEEYPLDYLAFRKRHGKWTEGNMEFIRRNTWKIIRSPMAWYEKLDIVLFTYSLPLTALFSLYVIINAIVFPAIGYTFKYPLWMLIPTVLFLIAPMLNDIITYWRQMKKLKLLSYLLHSTLLYGSMYYVSLRASLKSMFGSSVFHVTPKDTARIGFRQALSFSRGELLFGVVLASVVIWVAGSIFPVLLLVTPAVFAMYLVVMHNPKGEPELSPTE
jgi:cellulose synthase/poly-beta-1,6-N-acetylglucosamine synthase-like glycosyltransferase